MKILYTVILVPVFFLPLSGKELKKVFFSTSEMKRVISGDIITRMYLKYNTLGENTHLKIQIPQTNFTIEDFSRYEMITDEKAFIPFDLNTKSKLRLYNILNAYSRLEGMKYWSPRLRIL